MFGIPLLINLFIFLMELRNVDLKDQIKEDIPSLINLFFSLIEQKTLNKRISM